MTDTRLNGANGAPASLGETPTPASEAADMLAVMRELRDLRAAMAINTAEGLDAPHAAALCGVGEATWHRMNAAEKAPRPVRMLGCVRWLRSELIAWLRAGCPDRQTWERIRGS